jgi:hypothetical protein
VGVFSEHLAGWLGSNGRQARKAGAGSPFFGPVLGAAWGSGGFFVASHQAGAGMRDARLDVFGPDLSIRASIGALPIRPTRLLAFGPEDLVVAVGTSIARNPKVLLCAGALGVPPSAPACAEINPDGILAAGDNLLDAAEGPDGTFVASGRFGFIFFGALFDPHNLVSVHTDRSDAMEANGTLQVQGRPPIPWRAVPGVFQDASGVRLDLSEVRNVRFALGRLVVCLAGSTGMEAGNAITVSAPIGAGALVPNSAPPVFTVAHRAIGGSGCLGAAPVPGRNDAVQILYADDSSAVIDASGRVVGAQPAFTAPGLDRGPISLEESVAGYTLAVESAGEVFLRADLTGTSTFGQVYGLPGLTDAPVIASAAKGDERWMFRASGEIEVVRPDGTVLSTSMTLPHRDRLMGAAFDSKTDQFVLVGFNTKRFFGPPPITSEPWIRRLDPSDPSKLVPVDETLTKKPSTSIANVIFRSIAEVAPGRFAIIGEDARIFVLHDDVLDEAEVAWDDPGTAALEPEPAIDSECDFLRLRTDSAARDLWRQVAGVPGAAWIVGCSGAVVRVLPFASPPRAERVALGRMTQTQYVEGKDTAPLLSALGAVCPDEMYFAGRGESYRDRERGHVWTIRSRAPHESASAEPVFETMELLDADSNAAAISSVELDSGFPVALSARSGRVIVAFRAGANTRGSAHVVGSRTRYRLADGFTAAIEGPNGWTVLGTESGRVIVASPPARP